MNINYNYPVEYKSEKELRTFYEENGFVSIKNGLPIEHLNLIKKDLEEIFKPFATDIKNPFDSAVIELNKNDKEKLHELHILSSKLTSFTNVNARLTEIINAIWEISSKFYYKSRISSRDTQR